MRSVNKVILIGNVTRNPEMRRTQSGQAVCTFGLATNREWMTSDGRKKNSAEYHELVAWAQLADICEKYVRKGKLLYIDGYLKTRSWDTPEGIRKFKTEVVIQDMIMLEKRGNNDSYQSESTSYGSDVAEAMNDDFHGGFGDDSGATGDDDATQSDDSAGGDDNAAPATEETSSLSASLDDDLGL